MINFPNASRSLDEIKNRICFWGYDQTMEISFFLAVDALRQFNKDISNNESELLTTFDASIEQIYKVAAKIYKKGGSGHGRFKVILTASDF